MKKITVSPLETLIIHNGNIHLLDTTNSSNVISGAFISNGGISINSTHNSTSSSVGGSLTVGGGVGIVKNVYVGQDLVLDNSNSVFKVNGISENRLYLDNVTNKQFYISLDGVNKILDLTESSLKLNMTSESSNSSTGSLILRGGISVRNTSDAISITQGGAMTIAGGVSVAKNVRIGEDLYVNGSNYIEGSLYVKSNITTSNLYVTSNVTSNNALITNINNTNMTSSSIVSTNISTGVLIASTGITTGTANITTLTNINTTSTNVSTGVLIASTGITSPLALITNITSSNLVVINEVATNISTGILIALTGITSSSALITNLNTTNITASSLRSTDIITTNVSTSNIIVNSNLNANGNSNTVGSIFTTGGNVGIGSSSPQQKLTLSDANNVVLRFDRSSVGNFDFEMGMEGSNDFIFRGGDNNSGSNLNEFMRIAGNGNVGIATTNPGYTLDINGTFNCNNSSLFAGNTTSINSSTGAVVLSRGGLGINATANSSNVSNGGSLTVNGGGAIGKDFYIGGNLTVLSNNNTLGSLFTTNITSSNLFSSNIVATNITGSNLKISTRIDANGNSNTIGNIFTTGGNIGIGNTTPDAVISVSVSNTMGQLNLGNSIQNRKVVLFSTETNDHQFYGMGINNFSYRFQLDTTSASYDYYAANNSTSSNLLMKLNGNGNLDVYGNVSSSVFTGGNLILSDGITSGGLLVKSGTTSNVLITDNINIYSTTASNDVSSGALIVSGGVGVGGNLNVLGNTVINGNLTVSGSTVTVDSTNTSLKDNLMILNSGPSGTRDSGIVIQRYQVDNDLGTGDVVTDTRYVSDTLPNQTGMTSTQVKLSGSASAVDDYYQGWWIKVTSGFSNNQVRKITGYVGSTKVATLSSAWTTQNPSSGDIVYLYNKPYIGVIYDEVNDEIVFGSMASDPGQTNVTFTDNIPMKTFSTKIMSTQTSTNSTTGGLVSYGGISINNTTDSISSTNGGSFTSAGGGSFNKSVYIGGNLSVNGPVMKIPTGDTASRPAAPQVGYIYYNTDTVEYQGYLAGSWVSLSATGTLSDVDGNTKIMAEAFTGSNDNNLIFYTNGIERMRMNSAGNIGINTSVPNALFEINGTTLLSSTTNSVGVGTGGNLTVLGGASFSKDVYVGGTITSSSDIRLKENVTNLKVDKSAKITDKISKLRTIKFNYKHDQPDKKQIGFIAQDFINDFPELLRIPNENGYYTLDYSKITVLLVECIKELKAEIKELQNEIYHIKQDHLFTE